MIKDAKCPKCGSENVTLFPYTTSRTPFYREGKKWIESTDRPPVYHDFSECDCDCDDCNHSWFADMWQEDN